MMFCKYIILNTSNKCNNSRVFKSKPIQIKTANQSKKTENRKKPNIFGCVWMLFWKNRYDRIGFRIAFSKPNRTKPNCKSKFLYLFIILLVLYIA